MGGMSTRTRSWPTGVPCWADLTVPDVDAAKRFYTSVLGWSYRPTDIEFGGYAIAEVDGAAVAGLGPLPAGAPCGWTLYLSGDDADRIAATIPEHGGRLLVPPYDVGRLGRRVLARDPTGALFGVWQAGSHGGADVVEQPGSIVWEDLLSPDPAAARTFYSAVFGHRTQPLPDGGEDFHVFTLPTDDVPLGGIGGLPGRAGSAHWELYFAVADVEAAIGAAEAAGGRVEDREFDTPFGRMAALTDPLGACFHVLERPAVTPSR